MEGNSVAEPIAIIGMACRFPGANCEEEFWEGLMSQKCSTTPIPKDRWRQDQGCRLDSDSSSRVLGFLKCPVDEFDDAFFDMSPTEVMYTDPQQRLLLEVAWETFEDAGINPKTVFGTNAGIFSGYWTQDYRDLMIETGFKGGEFFRTYLGNSFGSTGARLSNFFRTTGPNIAVESGCSGSIVAIKLASDSLRNGECDVALACGANLLLHPYRLEDMRAVCSPSNRCQSFDEKADGFVRSEGIAVVLLKKLSTAIADGDRIRGIVKGIGLTQDGMSRSMGTPTSDCENLAMKLGLKAGNVSPNDVSYIEAHATGTAIGDPIEVKAIKMAYSSKTKRSSPLLLGSVKANIGHTEACSGMASLFKVIKSFENQVIPPLQSLGKLNPALAADIIDMGIEIPLTPSPWPISSTTPRIAGISNFGISGSCTHLILQEPPTKRTSIIGANFPKNIVTLSAKTKPALTQLLKNYQRYFESNGSSLHINDIAYTLNSGRCHFKHRTGFVIQNLQQLEAKIEESLIKLDAEKSKTTSNPSLCFLYSGQGSQYPGMGEELYSNFSAFREHFDNCTNFLLTRFDINIKDAIWGKEGHKLSLSRYNQTAIFSINYALGKLLENFGIVPSHVVGHSLGEFNAAVSAGLLDYKDALIIITSRGQLVDEGDKGAMIALFSPHSAVLKAKQEFERKSGAWLDIAAENAPNQTVLAGPRSTIEAFDAFCKQLGISSHTLESQYAYHSRSMDPILQKLKQVATNIQYPELGEDENLPVFVSSAYGVPFKQLDEHYWSGQTRGKVQFAKTCVKLEDLGITNYIEVGPSATLVNLVKLNLESKPNSSRQFIFCQKNHTDNFETFLSALAQLYMIGSEIEWDRFHSNHKRQKVKLLSYPFQRRPHWFTPPAQFLRNGNELMDSSLTSMKGNPFVGNPVNSPLSNLKIFRSSLTFDNVPWVKDHVLGNMVIVPGACYVSMGLSISKSLNKSFLVVSNIIIKSAWGESENANDEYEVQTVVEDVPSSKNLQVSIYTNRKNENEWTQHANLQIYEDDDHTSKAGSIVNLPLSQIQIKPRVQVSMDVYAFLKKLEYHFGPCFQTVRNIFKGHDDYLVELAIPEIAINTTSYVLHPIIIDAMMQTTVMIFALESDFSQLRVPISIDKFEIASPSMDISCKAKFFCHVVGQNATLYLEDGSVVAVLKGMKTATTTLASIADRLKLSNTLNMIQSLKPPMFKEIWDTTSATGLPPYELKSSNSTTLLKKVQKLPEYKDNVPISYFDKLNKSIGAAILKSFLEMGLLTLDKHTYFDVDKVITTFQIQRHEHTPQLMLQLLEFLKEDGFVSKAENQNSITDTFKLVPNQIPSLEELHCIIDNTTTSLDGNFELEWDYSKKFCAEMEPILKGTCSALELLFTGSDRTYSAERFYQSSSFAKALNDNIARTFQILIESQYNSREHELRILEIGAGTGSATRKVLPILRKLGIAYQYTFTDISSSFFILAEQKFKEFPSITYKTFNVENDPLIQNFPPEYYDIVIASNVLHATADLTITLENVHRILKPSGQVIIGETFVPHRCLDVTVGHLDGYHPQKDIKLRPTHCIVDNMKWEGLLRSVGFLDAMSLPVFYGGVGVVLGQNGTSKIPQLLNSNSPCWFIFSENDNKFASTFSAKFESCSGRTAMHVALAETPYSQHKVRAIVDKLKEARGDASSVEGYLYMRDFSNGKVGIHHSMDYLAFLQAILKYGESSQKQIKVMLCMEGAFDVDDQHGNSPVGAELLGMTRVFASENSNIKVKIVDVDSYANLEGSVTNLTHECFTDFANLSVAYRDKLCYTNSIMPSDFESGYRRLPLPQESNGYHLILPESKTITDLRFVEMSNPMKIPTGHNVQIQAMSSAVNFRDGFLIQGSISSDNLTVGTIGSDIAGIVTHVGERVTRFKVGDAVCGVRRGNLSLPSIAEMDEKEIALIPKHITFEQAATLPVVFVTVYHSLVTLGQLRAKETILIHTASGGVGLCAIQIAKHLKANIIATAGSPRKRRYLEQLGIRHVFNSRTLDYQNQVKEVTNGLGVNMVLNSLTGSGCKEASLSCMAKNGRFIEMSKINVWTKEDVQNIRPDVEYKVIDFAKAGIDMWSLLAAKLEEFMADGTIRPIPYTLFDVADIRNALTQQQRAWHIGKIVLKFPEHPIESAKLFNSRSTYLITGGTRGIGLAVACWMVDQGARFLVLVGRSALQTETLNTIRDLERKGCTIHVALIDVGDYDKCKELFENIRQSEKFPPIRGIMHSAGSLSDTAIPSQNQETFEICLKSKLAGSWNMHELTKDISLEHFVLFSSFATTFGSPGQANHAAGNSFMDSLATYRHSIGLPALSINWGQWGEVGIVAGRKIQAFTAFSTSSGINALEHLLRGNFNRASVFDGDASKLKSIAPWIVPYLKHIKTTLVTPTEKKPSDNVKADTNLHFWEKFKSRKSEGVETASLLRENVLRIVSSILQLPLGQEEEEEGNERDLHLDSLMIIELRNMLQVLLGDSITLSSSSFSGCSSVNSITKELSEIIGKHLTVDSKGGEGKQLEPKQISKHNEKSHNFHKLIQEDSKLWPETRLKSDKLPLVPLNNIRYVLLTGATGNLGRYILQILSKMPQIQMIYCLVRNVQSAEKLFLQYTQSPLNLEIDHRKISPISGALDLDKFGLLDATYENLVSMIDAVFHCAAYSNHLDDYQKDGAFLSKLRAVNVHGCQRILQFSIESKAKWVYYSSSIATILNPNNDGDGFPEDWLDVDEFENASNFGYAISKFVAEQLFKEAVVERGLPCKVFRLPLLCGDSRSGAQNVFQNHFFLKYIYYFQKGFMPADSVPQFLLPCDVAAKISCQLFFNENTPNDVYNVINPRAMDDLELCNIASQFGHDIEIISYEQWVQKLRYDEDNCLLKNIKQFYVGDDPKYRQLFRSLKYIDAWKQNPDRFFESPKVLKYIPDLNVQIESPAEILKRDIGYVIENMNLL